MSKTRRWLELGVVAIAAFASIATSRKKWHIEAQVPAHPSDKPRVALVEASKEPTVRLDNGEHLEPLPDDITGSARYLIPAGRKIEQVTIDGTCDGGGFCGGKAVCEPEGSKVVVVSIKPVTTWRREVGTATKTEQLQYERTVFPITHTHPVRLEVTSEGRDGRAYLDGERVVIDWHAYPEGPIKTTWSLRVIMEDVCPSEAPCEPPPSSTLELGKEQKTTRSLQ